MQERHIVGCLLGGAIGDALGMPFEEMPLSTRKKLYGNEHVADFMPGLPYKLRQQEVEAGSVTDDTEMVLASAESVVNHGAINVKNIADNLLKWLKRELPWLKGTSEGRNIGPTTRQALERYGGGVSYKKCGISSGGCGAAIRIAPIAMCCFNDFELLQSAILPTARITHRNPLKPLAEEGALCVATAIRHLLIPRNPENLINHLVEVVQTRDFKKQLTRVKDGLSESWSVDRASEELGTGSAYLATEVVSLAIFVFVKHYESFKDAVTAAINVVSKSGADTDCIASIAGALSGCYLGVDKIPLRWRRKVEYRNKLESLSQDLFKLISSNNGKVNVKE